MAKFVKLGQTTMAPQGNNEVTINIAFGHDQVKLKFTGQNAKDFRKAFPSNPGKIGQKPKKVLIEIAD